MTPTIQPVNGEARDVMAPMLHAWSNLAVVSSALDGEPVDLLASVAEDGNGTYTILPLAIVITEASGLFERLSDPATGLEA